MNMPGQLSLHGGEVEGTKDYYNRLLLAGDVHGEIDQVEYLFETARERDCQLIFQLGDFGYWTHTPAGRDYLEDVSYLATHNQIPFYWLDGNHENHIELRRQIAHDEIDGFHEVAEGVYYAPRGHRWTWRGKKFMAVGGAYSVDKAYRKVGSSWWPQEELEPEEFSYAMRPGKVDYLFTHDMPDGIDWMQIKWLQGYDTAGWRVFPESQRHQRMITAIANAVEPDVLFHGHMHMQYKDKLTLDTGKQMEVIGLDCGAWGGNPASVCVLDIT